MTLKQIRILKGISAVKVAEACGISKQIYSKLENKSICYTNEATARKIANYFGVSLFTLIGVENLKFKPRNKEELKEFVSNLKKEAHE